MDHIATPKVENVQLLDHINSKKSRQGTVHLTATHLLFVDNTAGAGGQGGAGGHDKEMWIQHSLLTSVDKLALTTGGSPLRLQTSDFRVVTLIVPRDRDAQVNGI